jgi:hypothetical protein
MGSVRLDNACTSKHNNGHEQVVHRKTRADSGLPLRGNVSPRYLPPDGLLKGRRAEAHCGRGDRVRGLSRSACSRHRVEARAG